MYSKLDNKQKATILEISDVANILAEAPWKLAEGLQYFLQVSLISLPRKVALAVRNKCSEDDEGCQGGLAALTGRRLRRTLFKRE